MNYLAHAHLSLQNDEIQLGNLMGDFIKGNQFENYSGNIRKGILLHRKIDSFTDSHELVFEAIQYFKPHFRLSGGIFVDILFDHFLANDDRFYNNNSLLDFTTQVNQNVKNNHHLLNEKMNTFFGHMINYNWLYNYKFIEGLSKSILGICKRHPLIGDGIEAMKIIESNYESLRSLYSPFFIILHNEIQLKYDEINDKK